MDKPSPTFSSLYSGCGGFDLGFKEAGFRCIKAIDLDTASLSTLARNGCLQTQRMDLSEFGDEHCPLIAGSDVLLAGPPCQGFSTAGLNDPDDLRNTHISNVARIALLSRPKVIIMENVRGLLSARNVKHFQHAISCLENGGYSVSYAIHNLADYGVPQRRVRVLMVATELNKPFELKLACRERHTVRDALKDVENTPDFEPSNLIPNSSEYKIAEKILAGQKLSNVRSGMASVHTWQVPEVFGSLSDQEIALLETTVKLRRQNRRRDRGDADPVPIDNYHSYFGHTSKGLIKSLVTKGYLKQEGSFIDLKNTFNGKFRRLSWDDVAPTVDTRYGQPRYFLHPSEMRGITFREAARLQGFPDTFTFFGSNTEKYRMIGNAVPPPFSRLIADAIIETNLIQ